MRALHALRRGGRRRRADLRSAGAGRAPRSSPTPTSRSRRTSPATRCRSARSARSPRARTASGPVRGTSTAPRPRASSARSAAAARWSPRRTGWSACSASTSTRSTRAGSATGAGTATSGCTASRGSPVRCVKRGGVLADASWPEALDAAADALRSALDDGGPDAIGVIGGARGTNEDAYAWARFAKGVLGDRQRRRAARRRAPRRGRARHAARRDRRPRPRGGDRRARARPQGRRCRSCTCACARPRSTMASRSSTSPRATAVSRAAASVVRAPPARRGGSRSRDRSRRHSRVGPPSRRPTRWLAQVEGREGPVVVILGRPSVAEPVDRDGARRGRARRAA